MIVTRVEKHILHKNNKYFKLLDNLCFVSKNLYNQANYVIRQEFCKEIKEGENRNYISYNKLDKIMQNLINENNEVNYKILPSQTSQQILRLLDKNWKSFFKSIKDWKKNSLKYSGKPKLPKYKDKNGRYVLIFTGQNQCKLKDGYIHFPKKLKGFTLKTKVDNVQQVRMISSKDHIIIEVIYKVMTKEMKPDNKRYLSIDIGINNFVTMSTNLNLNPIIINGKGLKSMNKYWNKQNAHYQEILKRMNNKHSSNRLRKLNFKRNNKMNDFMHKVSRFIINYSLENQINTIVLGYNNDFQRNSNLGKVNNQTFTQIPFTNFIQKLEYKCENEGINFIITEESYTSKASFLDNDKIPKYNKDDKQYHQFSGKRIKRGLYQTKDRKLLNADINASLNILKKVFKNAYENKLFDIGFMVNPIKVNII